MKLRIRDNSVGMRLTRDEIEILRKQGVVSARTGFPGGREFRYQLESSPASVAPAAFFSDNMITVRLPETTVLAWATTEQIAIEGEQVLVDGNKLNITVDKDLDGCVQDGDSGSTTVTARVAAGDDEGGR